ncbi:hypothetical protein JGH11_02280 [Dysgonomonas sp. Marseille-P4677]|uniref:DUF6249 domain-containing protein n=1 Tax=Dysgonomonas sp. Marseille-P4677 TaxID=2364790 RepID=UPI0019115C2C|nr:DUF6249 domain-containing protein [Dysgonomonas sp. Marseille-P4677]MBK5719693.1 hypothetical protein [Dysgonomonas sp. Marseille-P4677]
MDTLTGLTSIVAVLSAVALPIGLSMYIVLRSISTKHKERMELIRQGIIPPEQTKPTPNKYRSLRNGILCIGIALGLIISLVISYMMNLGEDQAFWVVSSGILLFLGLGYVVFYLLVKGKKEFDDDAE